VQQRSHAEASALHNMAMNDMVAQQIISTMERAVDAELDRLENLNDDDLARIRANRREEVRASSAASSAHDCVSPLTMRVRS
jgi:hypothetical protein